MILYILYRIGHFLSLALPKEIAYGIASIIADLYYSFARKDKKIVMNNIRVITAGSVDGKDLDRMARDVFRNFAKYLADFFSFSKISQEYMNRYVKLEGLDNIDEALSKGRGVILLSAHIGNWELGGAVASSAGYPLSGVVLTHQNKRINDFFTRQRLAGNVKPIEIGISLKSCYGLLKSNGILALLGDRDFTKSGIRIEFFGKRALIPKGPAVFSYRIGSAIVPIFMVREDGDRFRLVAEGPIYPDRTEPEEESVRKVTKRYLAVIESYVRKYPTQWFIFKDIWNNDDESLRPDTII